MAIKLLLAAGGTGGHIYPALALAEQYLAEEICFSGSADRLENKLVTDRGYQFYPLSVTRDWWSYPPACWQAYQLLREMRPEKIICFGGYTTIPVAWAGWVLEIPIYLQEQNILPGRVNRLISHIAQKVAIAYPDAEQYFPVGRTALIGNPIRNSIRSIAHYRAEPPRNGKVHLPQLAIIGGSQGARVFNEFIFENYRNLLDLDLHVKLATGHKEWERLAQKYGIQSDRFEVKENNFTFEVVPYWDNIEEVYRSCDMVMCRAGAVTLAELTVLGIPAILVPFPYAKDDHQQINADYYASQGASLLLAESSLSLANFRKCVKKLTIKDDDYHAMVAKMRLLGRPSAAQNMKKWMEQKNND